MSALANLTKYYWRVNAKNAGGTSGYSAVRAFTTISAIPLAPALITPPNNAVNQQVNVVLRWNKSNAATTYRLQVGTDETFATGVVFNDSTLTDTTKTMAGLANSTKYYWRVNAKNVAGTGVYSATWAFTTIVANPSIPVAGRPGRWCDESGSDGEVLCGARSPAQRRIVCRLLRIPLLRRVLW